MLRSVTGYNPHDQKFKERDGYKIIESGVSDIMREDRYSRKMGQLEEEADIERERRMKEKRRHRHDHWIYIGKIIENNELILWFCYVFKW